MNPTTKLSDYLSENGTIRIETRVAVEKRETLLEKMAELFSPKNQEKKKSILECLISSEKIRLTAVKGFAIPHTRVSLIKETQAAIITTTGTNYQSIDGQKVYFAIGILNPTADSKSYLPLLGTCAQMIKEEAFAPVMNSIIRGYPVNKVDVLNAIDEYEKQYS